jgi:hypothetical protein
MDVPALLASIERVFPATPLPQMSLRQAVLADQSLSRCISEAEWLAERRKDGHLTWLALSDEALLECRDGVAHLSEESFAYYLGAFLKFAVVHVNACIVGREGELLNTVVFSLTHRSNCNLGRLKRLTDAQIDCVVQVLQFVAQESETHGTDAAKSLARYWCTPEAKRRTVINVP